ncbi:MAG TPA: TRL-like family protein [Planctomycetota bacterium]
MKPNPVHAFHRVLGALLLGLSFLTSGCLFTDVKLPLDTNLEETKLGDKTGESSSQSVLWLVAWGDSGTQAAAQEGGIKTILHADQHVFSVLFGLYSRQTTIVYGE